MYRQVRLNPEDYDLQRILWRNSPKEDLKQYQLLTVTYGTSPASFLATRYLTQLAADEEDAYPRASEILKRDFYMDDLLTGCETIEEAFQLQRDLQDLLEKGGFQLRKWCSNSKAVMSTIPVELRAIQESITFSKNRIKTLDLVWNPALDEFQFYLSLKPNPATPTKRNVMSVIASIFDPLGLLGPVLISAKLFMQKLWKSEVSWDEELPDQFKTQWNCLYKELARVNDVKVDRFILGLEEITNIQVHGFSDASEAAYGACIYVRSVSKAGNVVVNLLTSKSRVAPIKQVSLPRLELCGALLLARLLNKILPILNLTVHGIYLWSDSTITLRWISSELATWQTFVANRVSEIQKLTEKATWRHVPSGDNPADILSRGIEVRLLKSYKLWWHGPMWLESEESQWPSLKTAVFDENMPEQRKTTTLTSTIRKSPEDIWSRYSSLRKLLRVLAYCLRFANNANVKSVKITDTLSCHELNKALVICIHWAQQDEYLQEMNVLADGKQLDKTSAVANLHPFLDNGLLRVGGRLSQSALPYESKHQLILPPNHHITKLIVTAEHFKLLHGGAQLMIASLRTRYWIPRMRQVVRKILHSCLTCFRMKKVATEQLMGELPKPRVQPARPFCNSGVDYAGPLLIKLGSKRSKVVQKCYIALFVCMSTKAVHLELVTDLTASAFIAALRRFIARRGKCQNLFSDNGTNFVKANRNLEELYVLFRSETFKQDIQNFAAEESFTWNFIPPSAPHFGGLWEANVKSLKYHLRRVLSLNALTYEELSTILCQIEACLNSRPLTLMSDDPEDLQPLTPGHFLIGSPLTALPEPNYVNTPLNNLRRWERLQKSLQLIWNRWSADYLNTLQQRQKWRTAWPDVKIGTVVLLKEDNLPALRWKIGIITKIYQGADNHVRVIEIRTASGTFKRPISKVAPLPLETKAD